MNWRNVWLITSREIRDQLRDRRTLFMVLVLPLMLYPALTIGMLQMQWLFNEQPRTVVVLGAQNLPEKPSLQLVDGNAFVPGWFDSPEHVKKLKVVTDAPSQPGEEWDEDDLSPERRARILSACRSIQESTEKREKIESEIEKLAGKKDVAAEAARLEAELTAVNEELARDFAALDVQVMIVIPDGFAGQVESLVESGTDDAPPAERVLEVRTVRNVADKKSHVAYSRVKDALAKWKQHITFARLEQADLPKSLVEPFKQLETDVSRSEERAAQVWGLLFPAILVIMCVTGAFHPAVDVAAGEKERGTMETLLICPASRTEIVLGKFNAVGLFSLTTAMLNLVSMGVTAAYVASVRSSGEGVPTSLGALTPPSLTAVVWVVVLSLPLAALFSALCLALATFARSSKEGQYYLTPLLMVTLGLTVFCMSPIAEIDPLTSVLPVVGPSLLLKELLTTGGTLNVLVYAVPVLVTSVGYSALALWWAIDQFKREDVLFREAERFDFRLWMQHLLRDKEPVPSFAEAGFCFVIVMLLYFASSKPFQVFTGAASDPGFELRAMQALMIQQLVVIATPALLMAVMLTSDPVKTLRLRWPKWQYLVAAPVLAVCLRPVVLTLMSSLSGWFFKAPPDRFAEQLEAMTSGNVELWIVLLAIAVAPGICEEITFRGFILSGFNHSHRPALAIVLSSLVFGLIHVVPAQVFHAFLLGLVIGTLAIRSRSLWPCILFHVASNGSQVLYGQAVEKSIDSRWLDPFVTYTEVVATNGELTRAAEFTWTTLVIATAISAAILYWLVMRRFHTEQASRSLEPTTPPGDVKSLDAASVG